MVLTHFTLDTNAIWAIFNPFTGLIIRAQWNGATGKSTNSWVTLDIFSPHSGGISEFGFLDVFGPKNGIWKLSQEENSNQIESVLWAQHVEGPFLGMASYCQLMLWPGDWWLLWTSPCQGNAVFNGCTSTSCKCPGWGQKVRQQTENPARLLCDADL